MIRETVPGDSIYHCLVSTFLRSGGNHKKYSNEWEKCFKWAS